MFSIRENIAALALDCRLLPRCRGSGGGRRLPEPPGAHDRAVSRPGGASDFVGRIIQPALAEQLRQQVVVDNRAGAAGNIGVEVAARAARRLQLPARQRRHDGDQPELFSPSFR